MFYTIYKTTNIINGKFYIGKHKTKNLNDGYIGSGKLLKRAIKKYGIDNFHTEILHICKDEKHMNLLEKILVVPDAETNYNLCPGGHGGWGYLNKTFWSEEKRTNHNRKVSPFLNKKWMKDNKQKIIEAASLGGKARYLQVQNMSQEERKKTFANNAFKGKSHTQEYKDKMSRIMKIKSKGSGNSQYGTCWITNGIENKKIKKEELDSWIELGYTKGRKFGASI